MAQDFPIFDYDGLGIGTNRNCNGSHIDCTPTRDCGNLPRSHDTRDCSACLLRAPRICIFGGCTGGQCIQRGNDPFCEASKAAQNVAYDADYAARKFDCERIKEQDKAVCAVNKELVKLDCERLKLTQMVNGEIWEAGIQEARSQARSSNPKPIPVKIRKALEPYFAPAILDSVTWTTDRGDIRSIASFSGNTITFGNIIVFQDEESALNHVGLWAHELEHVKQYELLGIDHFGEYYADYVIDEFLIPDSPFYATENPGPSEVREYVDRIENKLEALAGVQSYYVCDKINDKNRPKHEDKCIEVLK